LPDVRAGTLNVAWWRVNANEPEDTMTATSLTYLAAQEHINELRHEAERHRRAAELTAPKRVRLTIPRLFARRIARATTV
jgi:hypothetical protein